MFTDQFVYLLFYGRYSNLPMVYRSMQEYGLQSINDLAPTYLTEMFSRLSDTSERELRNTGSDLEIPMRKSAHGQKCFSYKGAIGSA